MKNVSGQRNKIHTPSSLYLGSPSRIYLASKTVSLSLRVRGFIGIKSCWNNLAILGQSQMNCSVLSPAIGGTLFLISCLSFPMFLYSVERKYVPFYLVWEFIILSAFKFRCPCTYLELTCQAQRTTLSSSLNIVSILLFGCFFFTSLFSLSQGIFCNRT